MQSILDRIEAGTPTHLKDLSELCRYPSVSAQSMGLRETAEACVTLMGRYGVAAHLEEVDGGPPSVVGELEGRSERTLLFYDHYDVQPPDPLGFWHTPPFEPTLRGGKLYARGVADNKGNLVARLAAVKAWLDIKGRLPVSVKFFVEGEEEIGSPHLSGFVASHSTLLAADACIWESGGVNWLGQPVITLGLKGILYVELEDLGAVRDIHSAGATSVVNPAWRLVWALASLKDAGENVLIDGFYDDVLPPSPEEVEAVRRMPSEEENTKASLGIGSFLLGLTGTDLRLRNIFAPTCTICGIWSGYTGEGAKTVLPSVARAKVDFRLVANMDPDDVLSKLRRHLDAKGFQDVAVRGLGLGEPAWRTPMTDPFALLVAEAAREAYGLEPVIVPSMTGSGPMHAFGSILGLPIASSGASYPDSGAHAPNEHIRVDDFVLAAKHAAVVMGRMGGQAR